MSTFNYFLFAVTVALGLLIAYTSGQYAYITVYIQPQPNSLTYVKCWANNTNIPAYSQNFSCNGEISWTITKDYYNQPYDAFWCRATMGNSILTRFPLFGDGLPRNSSEWLINSIGKRRISSMNTPTNDNKAVWVMYY